MPSKQQTGMSTTARPIRPAPTRRNSLASVLSFASKPASGSMACGVTRGTHEVQGSDGFARLPVVSVSCGSKTKPPLGKATASMVTAAKKAAAKGVLAKSAAAKGAAAKDAAAKRAAFKRIADQAASAKVAAAGDSAAKSTAVRTPSAPKPDAEALAGLLSLSGSTDILGGDVDSTRGASLTALSRAIGSMDVAGPPEGASASMTSVRYAVDECLEEDDRSVSSPAAKRTKTSGSMEPPCGGGHDTSSARVPEEQPSVLAPPVPRVPPLSSVQKLAFAEADELSKKQAAGMATMVGARRLLKELVKDLAGNAKKSADSFLSPRRRADAMVNAVRVYVKCTNDEAM
eukprot:TRINITY_DN4329_c0_g1_i2.p1 TRINITY_DN4329_c0_g1~~TRINITY_DN4329_c0_g1_i2.p1  ORF type:complete len:345 (-),score=59.29 TRINITY_DN4329_c0_g1_i2:1374-2408(-)